MQSIKELQDILPQIGQIELITFRTQKKGEIETTNTLDISIENGIAGDHQSKKGSKRMVTLIQKEHLDVVGALLKRKIDIKQTRRNILVSGINLLALHNRLFKIGNDVILKGTGYCVPCSQMETNLGPGGFNAMRGHGGITAEVIQGGTISVNDPISLFKEK